ncbi:hypothetical protein HIM_01744 [Hirsutella minnesotensis 3608]|nr:hypothetical protein HIM_01744 [Hirsutella minnesotensis 3608]
MAEFTHPTSESPATTSSLQSPRFTFDGPQQGDVVDATEPLNAATASHDSPRLRTFASPMRHHKRTPSAHREIKETLDARVEFASDETDGRTYHRINQYVIMEEIGRGSYGAVHLAADQFGNEFAMKEFSKARLRKRAQSHLLRQGPHAGPRLAPGPRTRPGNGPLSPQLDGLRASERKDALFLIREEIAIMKKLNHPNLVQLIEVLDDPEEDSLYMVLEMCKKGVVMNIDLDDDTQPYDDETCRCWFRDLILGIEYLHAQGVIHRDIKPDNLLLSQDDVLKIVDFGVSEMFEKQNDMVTAKSAGSPAFLAPELCDRHRGLSGKAADIWSMGVSLFCLKYGRLPFVRPGILEIYEAIKMDEPSLAEGEDASFVDLMRRILDKDPDRRITMAELREHAWVTKDGTDPLLSAEENCAHMVEPPNELELNRAFTRKMNHLLCVMKAIHRFRAMLLNIRAKARADAEGSQTALGPVGNVMATEEIEHLVNRRCTVLNEADRDAAQAVEHPLGQEPMFLGIGTGARDDFAMDKATPDVVSDSPTAVDFDIYDRAYEDAVQRQIKANRTGKPKLYLNKFVKEAEHLKKLGNLVEDTALSPPALIADVKDSKKHLQQHLPTPSGGKLAQLVAKVGISSAPDPETGE